MYFQAEKATFKVSVMKQLLRKIALIFALVISAFSYATHNRSGEITYQWVGGNQYRIRITTYTNYNGASVNADRCEQTLYISKTDGTILDSVLCPRVNGTINCSGSTTGA